MNTEYVYKMAECRRSHARALYAEADRALHDENISVRCREALAANFRTQAALVYDQADEMDKEAKRMWRGEAGMEDAA
jgi:hypothetical protein